MDTDTLRDRWRGAAAWLDASPAEVAGLVVLVVGALSVVGVLWWTGRPVPVVPGPSTPPSAASDVPADDGAPVGADEVTVHVAGAVGAPGLVRLPVGARVADAVEAAGGLLLDADPGPLNLARTVADGERIDVPRVGEPAVGASGGGAVDGDGGVRADGLVDLNRATPAELEELPGVGPVLASGIIAFRDANGPFTEVGQLREVSGIGEKTFQSLAPLVAV